MKKLSNISGVTLIEILLGIVISVIMMGAMLTSYNVVNNSYSQVTDKAKISNQGKVVLGMIMADIRNAGFKYYGDTVKTTNEHVPILITKASNFNTACDTIIETKKSTRKSRKPRARSKETIIKKLKYQINL